MGDHAFAPGGAEILFDAELDGLIVRFEGLLEVCKLLEQRGATEPELNEHRRELECVGRRLAALAERGRARGAPLRVA
jgi:hypothetical protein